MLKGNILKFAAKNVPLYFTKRLRVINASTATIYEPLTCSSKIIYNTNYLTVRKYCTVKDSQDKREDKSIPLGVKVEKPKVEEVVKLSSAQKLKKAVAEYGSTVIIFHVGISLISLGTCYVLVSNGLDVSGILLKLGMGSEGSSSNLAANAGTFVTAYAIHKVFAPVRISITLGATPFIVRYLRTKGILKK